MRLLLDTHVVLWALGEPTRIAGGVRSQIADTANELAVSAATAWEVAIKTKLGKLNVPGSVGDWLIPAVAELGAQWLAISAEHAAAVEVLPLHHRDPFDRMLVAQARQDGWTIVTADASFGAYGVPLLRA